MTKKDRLRRVLETEAMDTAAEAIGYNTMDHAEVNRRFVDDLLALEPDVRQVVDLGTGTALIPIELCRRHSGAHVVGVDMAESMLAVGRENIAQAGAAHAGLAERIELVAADAKRLPYPDGRFTLVISNSIVHHIPEPLGMLAEALRVLDPGGKLLIRDLMRPPDSATVTWLVETYAAGANSHQRQMFDDSLRAALDLDEIRALVSSLGHDPQAVRATSDRHWTWTIEK
jgi:ubiquinone/menaquinone biosynthesis C-methylase UbiE